MTKIALAILAVIGAIALVAVVISILLHPLSNNSATNVATLAVTAILATTALISGFRSALDVGMTLLADKVQEASRVAQLDTKLFAEIRGILPSDGAVDFLRTHDYAASFPRRYHDQLTDFVRCSSRAEFEFFDKEMEELKLRLTDTIRQFGSVLGSETFTLKTDPQWSRVPPDDDPEAIAALSYMAKDEEEFQHLLTNQREKVTKARADLNNLADEICSIYDDFIRTGRRTLGELQS